MTKFFKIKGITILLILLIGVITACDYTIVKTEESEKISVEKTEETPKEEVKQTPQIGEQSKQEVLAENIKTQSSTSQKNVAPTILITEPDSNEIVTSSPFTLGWQAEDPNNDKLLIKLEYEKDGKWVLLADNIVHGGNFGIFDWDLGGLSNGAYTVRVTVTDGILSASSTKSFEINR